MAARHEMLKGPEVCHQLAVACHNTTLFMQAQRQPNILRPKLMSALNQPQVMYQVVISSICAGMQHFPANDCVMKRNSSFLRGRHP